MQLSMDCRVVAISGYILHTQISMQSKVASSPSPQSLRKHLTSFAEKDKTQMNNFKSPSIFSCKTLQISCPVVYCWTMSVLMGNLQAALAMKGHQL